MDYQKAKNIRGSSFSDLMSDKLIGGQGIGSALTKTISDKSKARMTGIKEKFDPLNLAKKLTFGSRLGPALLGKVTGRSQRDIKYFAGESNKQKLNSVQSTGMDSEELDNATGCLGRIYELLRKDMDEKKALKQSKDKFLKDADKEEEKRNGELIKALTGRKKKKEPAKESKLKVDKKKQDTQQKKAETETKVDKKKTNQTTKKKDVEKTAEKQKTEVKQKTEGKPKAEKVPEVKPSAPSAPSKISTAAKIVAGTAGATGIFTSSSAFSKTMYPYAEKASNALGGKVPPVAILGQWSGESGGGKSLPAPFNYAGIKAGKNDKKGDYVLTEERYTDDQIKRAEASGETLHKVLGPDDTISKKGRQVTVDEWFGKGSMAKAQSEGKKWVQVKSYFAKFDDFEEFTNRYVDFLSSPRYAKARESSSPAQFGLEVAKAGYATASADKYSAKVAGFAENFSIDNNTGSQIDQASKENKNLKEDTNGDRPAQIINNTTINNKSSSKTPTPSAGDDRSSYDKKLKG